MNATEKETLIDLLTKALVYVERVANTNPTGVVPALKKRQQDAALLAREIHKAINAA